MSARRNELPKPCVLTSPCEYTVFGSCQKVAMRFPNSSYQLLVQILTFAVLLAAFFKPCLTIALRWHARFVQNRLYE